MYKVEKIEIVNNKVFCTIYNKYERFNLVPLENLKLVTKNNGLYAKIVLDKKERRSKNKKKEDNKNMK